MNKQQKSSIHISPRKFHPNYLLVAIPSRGMVSCEFVSSLLSQGDPLNMSIQYRFEIGGEVGESRNRLVEHALKNGYKILVDTAIQGIHLDSSTRTFFFNSDNKPVAVRGDKILENL